MDLLKDEKGLPLREQYKLHYGVATRKRPRMQKD